MVGVQVAGELLSVVAARRLEEPSSFLRSSQPLIMLEPLSETRTKSSSFGLLIPVFFHASLLSLAMWPPVWRAELHGTAPESFSAISHLDLPGSMTVRRMPCDTMPKRAVLFFDHKSPEAAGLMPSARSSR